MRLTYTVEQTTNLVSSDWKTNGLEFVGAAGFSNGWTRDAVERGRLQGGNGTEWNGKSVTNQIPTLGPEVFRKCFEPSLWLYFLRKLFICAFSVFSKRSAAAKERPFIRLEIEKD